MSPFKFPAFRPHPLIRGGHAQTLMAVYLPGRTYAYRAQRRTLLLEDGDTIVLHDDRPPQWKPGDLAVLLIHGLSGCHRSQYMVRVAGKFNDAGVRVFRMDLRGCGAGRGMARLPYHAGRSDDALAALYEMQRLCPGSPLAAVGFSLGGNIILKMLGEQNDQLPPELVRAATVNPAIDLAACIEALNGPLTRLYDRHFVKKMFQHINQGQRMLPPAGIAIRRPRMQLFDDCYTAPVSGFGSAENYYAQCSAFGVMSDIRVPTLVLAAADDPLVPVRMFEQLAPSPSVRVHITGEGGHLGFIGRKGADPDRRWMDWRVIEWTLASQAATQTRALAPAG